MGIFLISVVRKAGQFSIKKVSYLENFAVQAKTFKWGMPVPPTDLK